MDYSVLCDKIKVVEKNFPNSIIRYPLGDKELFLLDTKNHPQLDSTLQLHRSISEQSEVVSKELVELFHSDKLIRDFYCCNFAEFCKNFYVDDKNDRSIEKLEGFPKDVDLFKVLTFGFSKKNARITDEYPGSWLKHLSQSFYFQMQRYGSIGHFNNLCECIRKGFDILGVDYEYDGEYLFCDAENSPTVQAFFQAWQLHHFFERYIIELFENESGLKCINNPVVFVNPTIDGNGRLRGYVELDGCLANSKKGIVFIECKNSSTITQNYLFKFLGEVGMFEKIYAQEFNKCLVSTGSRAPIFEHLEDYASMNNIKLFDLNSCKKDYSDLKKFAKMFA